MLRRQLKEEILLPIKNRCILALVAIPLLVTATNLAASGESNKVLADKLQSAEKAIDSKDYTRAETLLKQSVEASQSDHSLQQAERELRLLRANRDLVRLYALTKEREKKYSALLEVSSYASSECNHKTGSTQEVEALREASELASQLYANTSKESDTCRRYGDALEAARMYAEAVVPLSRAAAIDEKTFDLKKYRTECSKDGYSNSQGNYVADLNSLSRAYSGSRQTKEATETREKIVAMNEGAFPPYHQNSLGDLRDLACIYRDSKQYPQAIATFNKMEERTRTLREKLKHWPADLNFKPSEWEHAWALMGLYTVYLDMNDDANAARICKQLLPEEEELAGKDSRYVADILENYAEVLRHQGLVSEAKPLEDRAKRIRIATHTQAEHRVQAKIRPTK